MGFKRIHNGYIFESKMMIWTESFGTSFRHQYWCRNFYTKNELQTLKISAPIFDSDGAESWCRKCTVLTTKNLTKRKSKDGSKPVFFGTCFRHCIWCRIVMLKNLVYFWKINKKKTLPDLCHTRNFGTVFRHHIWCRIVVPKYMQSVTVLRHKPWFVWTNR